MFYNPESHYSYINGFYSICSNSKEKNLALKAFEVELKAGKIDGRLEKYLQQFFDTDILVPIFSCQGHGEENGYVLFRSKKEIYKTLNIFEEILLKYKGKTDLRLHYWNRGALGYCLYFENDILDNVMVEILTFLRTCNI